MRTLVGAALALALLGCVRAPGPSGWQRQPTAMAPIVIDSRSERLLAVEVAGQLLGSLALTLDKTPDGRWIRAERVRFQITRSGGGADAAFTIERESISKLDAEHRLTRMTAVEREADVEITWQLARDGDEFVRSYLGPGYDSPEIERFAIPPDYRDTLEVEFELLAEWQRTGEAATRRFASFDLRQGRFEMSELTFLGEVEFRTEAGERIPAYRLRGVEEDGTVTETTVDHDFLPLSYETAGTYTAYLVDELPALGRGGARLSSKIPVTGAAPSASWELDERSIVATVDAPNEADAPPLWESGHYHEVEREGSRYALRLLATRPGPDFAAPDLPLTVPAEVERFLAPTPMSQSDAPAIAAWARSLADGETDALEVARRVVAGVHDRLDKRGGVRGSATATEVLDNGEGDCTEHAVLVVALMRALGIPARTVSGIILAPGGGDTGIAVYHAWAEIWLGRWIGVDATLGDTGTAPRYLQFGLDEPGEPSTNGKLVRAFGKIRIQLE